MRIDVTDQYLRRLYKPDPKIFVVKPERIESVLTEKQRTFKANKAKAIAMHLGGYSTAEIAAKLNLCERQAAYYTRHHRLIDERNYRKAQRTKRKTLELTGNSVTV